MSAEMMFDEMSVLKTLQSGSERALRGRHVWIKWRVSRVALRKPKWTTVNTTQVLVATSVVPVTTAQAVGSKWSETVRK